ncbi:MAG TPA: cupin domain-containing protein [Nevskia sp.]|jgi:predicted cupin superfamily sugar epimerase|nr:cupin domain-containing protein [Nevskia sp.]
MSAMDWVAKLQLEPHPEGGYFKRIYTSPLIHAAPQAQRPLCTSIYYLLTRDQPLGRLHRNRSDILHYFLDGGPLEYLLLGADGALRRERLGGGDARFLLVPGGCWKASHLLDGASHALIAEVVTPGFDYADHQFCAEADLLREHPRHLEILRPFLKPHSR